MRVTSVDVARAAGVSQATVSYVLNANSKQSVSERTRKAVLKAVEDLGYRPNAGARALRLGRSDIVLMATPVAGTTRALDVVINIAGAALAKEGMTLVTDRTLHPDDGERERAWLRLDPAAVIDIGLRRGDPVIASLRRAGIGIVSVNLPGATASLSALDLISDRARLVQIRHLLDRGHRRLVMAGPRDIVESTMGSERMRAIRRVVKAAGGTFTVQALELTTESLSACMAGWHDVDAVAAHNDEIAIGLLSLARRNGIKVPHDLAIIGLDNDPLAEVIGLTSVDFQLTEVAQSLAATTIQMVAGHAGERHFTMPEMVVLARRTT